jgi:hypothetical protein
MTLYSCVNLLPPPDDISFLRAAHTIYVQHSKFPEALGLSIRLGDPDLIRQDFNAPGNPSVPCPNNNTNLSVLISTSIVS